MGRKAGKSIEWADWVWNPVKGKCPAAPNCHYCYMLEMANRFRWNPEKRTGVNPELRLDRESLNWKPPAGCLVFCCSSLDLMHPDIEYTWIEETIRAIQLNPQAAYALLTKWPEQYEEFDWFPVNAWLGTTWDGLPRTAGNIWEIHRAKAIHENLCWISFEPLLKVPAVALGESSDMERVAYADWIVIGADSRPGQPKPPGEWADMLIDEAKTYDIPVWVKDNYGYEGKYGVLKERHCTNPVCPGHISQSRKS